MAKIKLNIIEENGEHKVLLPESVITTRKGPTNAALGGTPLRKEDENDYNYIPWGKNNKLPTEIKAAIEAVPMSGRAIKQLVEMLHGNGIKYYITADKSKSNTIEAAYIQEVEDFLANSRINTNYFPAVASDYRYYMNAFAELIWDNKKSKIARIYPKQAEFCRLSKENKRDYTSDNLLYSKSFVNGDVDDPKLMSTIPLYKWWDHDAFLEKSKKTKKFAFHILFPTPGVTDYATPFWFGLFKKNGWMDVAANVPKIISAMQKNQVSIKYQIMIPESYFEIRYPELWANPEKREELINQKINEINTYLAGSDNVYKSIAYVFKSDPQMGDRGKIEIVAIDDKTKKGTWVPDSNAADAQIVLGLGLHPSQVGLQPEGGKMGAGSGSDQRESFNQIITLNTLDQNLLLEPLNLISRINKWGVTFFIDHTFHTTTNQKEDGLQPSATTTIVK